MAVHLGSVCERCVDSGDGAQRPSPDVERAAQRLARPAARVALALKRIADVVLALAMLVALLPVLLLVLGLLLFAGDGGWIEKRERLGRHGRTVQAGPLPRVARRHGRARAGARGRA